MRTTCAAMRLADLVDLQPEARADVYYTTLLRFLGCTADAATTAAVVRGDEAEFYAAMAPVSMGSAPEQLRAMTKAVAPGASWPARARQLAAMMTDRRGPERMLMPHCEVGARLAERLGLSGDVVSALGAAYARWDGNGVPAGLEGEGIPPPMRIAIVARDVVLLTDRGDGDVTSVLASRRGRALDPDLVDAATANLDLLAGPVPDDLWERTIDAEPSPPRTLTGEEVDEALTALADFADLKFDETAGHSREVASLAATAAQLSGASDDEVHLIRRAGLVHDLGRVGVPNTVWSHPGQLTAAQWEQVRLHPYYGERILARTPALRCIARLAASDHERTNGSGYHRASTDLSQSARLLAVADAHQAMSQPRPHRDRLPADAIATELRNEVSSGRFVAADVDAVLAAASGSTTNLEIPRPANLTEREVDVLPLPIPHHAGRSRCAVRPFQRPRDHRAAPPAHGSSPPG